MSDEVPSTSSGQRAVQPRGDEWLLVREVIANAVARETARIIRAQPRGVNVVAILQFGNRLTQGIATSHNEIDARGKVRLIKQRRSEIEPMRQLCWDLAEFALAKISPQRRRTGKR